MSDRTLLLAALALLTPLGCSSEEPEPTDDDDATEVSELSAAELGLARITVNQAVQVPLMAEGETADRNGLPVVAGRKSFFRAFVTIPEGWVSRSVWAQLTLRSGLGGDELFVDRAVVAQDSRDSSTGSTFNWEIPGESLRGDTEYRVDLLDADPDDGPADPVLGWPETGLEDLNVHTLNGGKITIRILPLRYQPDGTGRLPDTSEEQLGYYIGWLDRTYPAREIEITVEDPVDTNQAIYPGGNGWGETLDWLGQFRDTLGMGRDEYLYGVLRPTEEFADYCSGGCTAGLSNLGWDSSLDELRVSMGLGYTGAEAALTFIHEIGHAHGRMHAPCGVSDADWNYPYEDAALGAWGWDKYFGELVDPEETKDFMSYCNPDWVSDYTYGQLFRRIRDVNGQFGRDEGEPWRRVVLNPEGKATLGQRISLHEPPPGPVRYVRLLGALGNVVGTTEARLMELGDAAVGMLYLPEPGPGVVAIDVDGQVLAL